MIDKKQKYLPLICINQVIKTALTTGVIIILLFTASSVAFAQQYISTTDDFSVATKSFEESGKLILAVYTEDEELQKDYFDYILWHDSLINLLNEEYEVYTQISDYNGIILLYDNAGILSYLELEEDPEVLYRFLKNISSHRDEVDQYIKAEKVHRETGQYADSLTLHTYLTTAKNLFKVGKEDELEAYLALVSKPNLTDSLILDLMMYHSQTMGRGYTLMKQMIKSFEITDKKQKEKIKESMKRILENTYLEVLSVADDEVLLLMFREFGWYLESFETQAWNNRHKYAMAKYSIALDKKGNKEMLAEKTKLFVNNWIMNQIKSDIPFLTAEEIAYDLAAFTDLMLDRKISRSMLPDLLPWIEESMRLFDGFQIRKIYAQLLDKIGRKKEALVQDRILRQYRSRLSSDMIKQSERKVEDALEANFILIDLLDRYFFPEMFVMP